MDPKILETCTLPYLRSYVLVAHRLPDASERVEVARQLLDFDREISYLFSGKPAVAERAGVSMKEFQALWIKMELMQRSLADLIGLVNTLQEEGQEELLHLNERQIARFASDV